MSESIFATTYNDYSQLVRPDERDISLFRARVGAFNSFVGPRCGDFVIMPDGTYERFCHEWEGEGMQTCHYGSFHLSSSGYASMSGSCNPMIAMDKLQLTDEIKEGVFWMFHHDYMTSHNSIGLKIDCRVYRVI